LRVRHDLPLAAPLLEYVQAAVRLGDFFAVLHALGSGAVRHHDDIGSERFKLVLVSGVGRILHIGAGRCRGGDLLLLA